MESIAIGCGITPQNFRLMTPREVNWRINEVRARENRTFERIAQLACWVINPWISEQRDKYTVSKLLVQKPRKPAKTNWTEWVK